MDNVLVKLCTKCGRELPATAEFFHLHKIHRDGLSSQCKECRRQNHKEQYSHPDVREQILARVKAHYNPEYKRVYDKVYHSRSGVRERVQEQKRIDAHKRRALKRAIAGIHTPEQIQGLLKRQKHKCYYCSARFRKRKRKYIYQIDHTFPLTRVAGGDIPANDISYLVLACPTCNNSKHDK